MNLRNVLMLSLALTACASTPPAPTTPTEPAPTEVVPEAPKAEVTEPAQEAPVGTVVTTSTGLRYVDVKLGTGASPRVGQTVVVHYAGTFTNGQTFDSSWDRGEPLRFRIGVGQVIQGWDEGVMSMKVGGRRKLMIPSRLAYGDRGAGGVIPPNTDLDFDVELLGIE
ncbi:FKBP-type peptidyl-prolyl cis-trans isomerase [Myxococcota bacterium]|nr:FKBP-type peptidyl-prolyl cis-trans isomerase [Myxococcota bacterium]